MNPARLLCVLAATLLLGGCGAMKVQFPNAAVADAPFPQRTVTATLAKPDGEGPYPAVVLLHSCGGILPHVADEWPQFLVSLGYVALTVDTFGSRGLAPCPNPLAGIGPPQDAHRELVRDAWGALDYLGTLPFVQGHRVAVMGFSLGGDALNGFLLQQPRRGPRDFDAGIALYGSCEALKGMPARLPMLQLAGELDRASADTCRPLAPLMEVHVLPGAHHAWDSRGSPGAPGGTHAGYSAEATQRSRQLVRDFLARQLRP